jgi:hypothetical protein
VLYHCATAGSLMFFSTSGARGSGGTKTFDFEIVRHVFYHCASTGGLDY